MKPGGMKTVWYRTFAAFLYFMTCWGSSYSKGALEQDPNELEEYDAEPRDPVKASKYLGVQKNMKGTYDNWNLAYYAPYYRKYAAFINTKEYNEMKNDITNSTKVCVNFDVSDNGTYLGMFTCPLPSVDHEDFTECCGEPFAEFCCIDDSWLSKEVLYGGLALGGILLGIILIGCICYCFLGKRK